MSFFINNSNPNRPGPICGNPLNGLNEKILIEVPRVFDACMHNETLTGITLTTTGYSPENPALPLTYISAETDQTAGVSVSNVVITRLDNRPNFANVSGQVTFPLVVTYRDAKCLELQHQVTQQTFLACYLFHNQHCHRWRLGQLDNLQVQLEHTQQKIHLLLLLVCK